VGSTGRGYPSDLTDEQWALVAPLLPLARVGPKGGRREKHPRRRIVDAIFYVVRTDCAWRQLPKDFAPWPTVYWYFTWWHDDEPSSGSMKLSVAESVQPRATVLNRPPG